MKAHPSCQGLTADFRRAVDGHGPSTPSARYTAPVETAPSKPERTEPALFPCPEPIVGRAAERADLTDLLARRRLVTLVGPGGVGKTRLALDAARAADPPGIFVDLGAAEDVAGALAAVVHALRLEGSAGEPEADRGRRIGDALASVGPTLLVCDNLEQVLGLGRWIAHWLGGAPDLTVLATSRTPLAVSVEAILELGPMSAADARALFAARQPGAPLVETDDPTDPTVDALLDRLDRVPLAIELAAARTRFLPPAALLERLDAGHVGLGRGAWRDRPSRQADLSASFAWSWRLLDAHARADLSRCAVFRGPFDLDAALAVLGESGLDGLAALLDQSLLRRVGDERFAVFNIVRDFALAEGAADVVREATARHRDWFITQGRSRAALAHGPNGDAACAWLHDAQANIVAAIRDALDDDAPDAAIDGLRALRPLVYTGAIDPAYGPLLDRVCAGSSPLAIGWARCLRGELARHRGRLRAAEADLEAAAGTDDAALAATAHAELGIVAHELGDLERAAAHHRAALDGFDAIGDTRGVGRAQGSIAITRHARGFADEARDAYEQALDTLAAAGDRRSGAIVTSNLGDLHLESGRLGEAEACYDDARRTLAALGDRRIAAAITGNLGGVLLAEGETELAIERRQEAVEALSVVGDHRLAAVFRGYLGLSRHVAGDLEAAVADYAAAEKVLAERGDRRHGGVFAAHRAAALAAQGDIDGAAAALDDAESILSVLDEPAARAVPRIHRGHLHLANRDRAAAEACLTVGGDEGEDQRVARRLLRTALGEHEAPTPPSRLVVAADGQWFEAPGAERADLGRRYVLHRLLTALVQLRLRSPGAGIDLHGLLEAGWPGERMSHASGANRVYVAVATLRKEGLGDVLLKRPAGYMLDPTLAIDVVETSAA